MDGDTFAHLVFFLRHGICPKYSLDKKHPDTLAYMILRQQAEFFDVQQLVDHIDKERLAEDPENYAADFHQVEVQEHYSEPDGGSEED